MLYVLLLFRLCDVATVVSRSCWGTDRTHAPSYNSHQSSSRTSSSVCVCMCCVGASCSSNHNATTKRRDIPFETYTPQVEGVTLIESPCVCACVLHTPIKNQECSTSSSHGYFGAFVGCLNSCCLREENTHTTNEGEEDNDVGFDFCRCLMPPENYKASSFALCRRKQTD